MPTRPGGRRRTRAAVVLGLTVLAVAGSVSRGGGVASAQAPGPSRVRTPAPATAPVSFDGTRAFEHLKQMVAIGPRPAGSPQIRQTRAYITRQMAAIGLTVQEQPFVAETPLGPVEMVNLIVRIPGPGLDRILVTGHYDTKLMRNARFVGASDGASSAAFLIELARVLKSRPRLMTYELVWFDGEEAMVEWQGQDHTYGSRYYVQAARKANALASIKAMVLVDMIGDTDLQLRRDSNSTPWLNDIIWGTARRMAYGRVFVDAPTAIEDDHAAFMAAGVPSVDLIDLDYPYWHTPDDDLSRVSARSLQIVGDVLVAALPDIETHLKK